MRAVDRLADEVVGAGAGAEDQADDGAETAAASRFDPRNPDFMSLTAVDRRRRLREPDRARLADTPSRTGRR